MLVISDIRIPKISRVMGFEDGETVQIYGDNFQKKMNFYWWRPQMGEDVNIADCGMPFGNTYPELPPEDALKFEVSAVVNGQVAYIYAEKDVPAGVALFWAENGAGISAPFMVNKPEIWNQSYRKTYGGAVVSFYGDGFYSMDYKHAYLKNIATGELCEARVVSHNNSMYPQNEHHYSTNIRIPNDIADGEYEVYIHAGIGGTLGWSEPVRITVENEYSLTEYYRTKWSRDVSDRIRLNAKTVKSLPANALGAMYDITAEIQNAVDEVYAQGGGIVMLSAGTYGITSTINLKSGVVLQGAGKEATTIRVVLGAEFTQDWSDCYFASRPSGGKRWAIDWQPYWAGCNHRALLRISEDAGVEEIRFELGDGANIGVLLASNDNDKCVVNGAFLNCVTVDGTCLKDYESGYLGDMTMGLASISSTYELTLYNCNLIARAPVYILPAYNFGMRMVGNILRCSPRQVDEAFICGIHNSIFIENDFVDGRRSFMTQESFENNWVYQNRSTGVSRGFNANEVYMSEYGATDWTGRATAIGNDYIEANLKELEDNGHWPEYDRCDNLLNNVAIKEYPRYLVIIDGKGLGQYRGVKEVCGNRLILDAPFDIMPDENTAFTVLTATIHNIWIDNNSEFSNSHSQFIWGSGIENIIVGHEIRLAGGIRIHSACYYIRANTTGVAAFNKILHCQVMGSGKGIWLDADGYKIKNLKPDYVRRTSGGMIGNSIRQCVFDGMRGTHYVKNLSRYHDHNPHCGVAIGGAFTTVCANRIGSYTTAVKLLDDCPGNCFDNNHYSDNDVLMSGRIKPLGTDVENYHINI